METDSKNYALYYEIFISSLALISVIMIVADFSSVINIENQPYKFYDNSILLIFWLDYIVRLFKSENKLKFIKHNVLDLLAIIPFNFIFSFFRLSRVFRLAKITRLMKFTRVLRLFGFVSIIKKNLSAFLKTNGFIYMLYCSFVLILLSTVLIMFVENQTFSDALWWSIVTSTTVGYGDISPTTSIGRVIAVILMVFGIGFIGMLTGTITTFFLKFSNNDNKNSDLSVDEIVNLIDSLDDITQKELIEVLKNKY